MRWTGAAIDPADPTLPAGVEALADQVEAPPELARRLSQIGVIAREDARALHAELKAGQRFVSREGDLWRWDGFSVAANAPTGAPAAWPARTAWPTSRRSSRPAPRGRGRGRRRANEAETEARSAAEAETAARGAGARSSTKLLPRTTVMPKPSASQSQRGAAVGARRSDRTPDREPRRGCAGASSRPRARALPPSADIETRARPRTREIEVRARLAEVRAESQALARGGDLVAPACRDRRRSARLERAQRKRGRADQTLEARVEEARANAGSKTPRDCSKSAGR